MELPRDEMAFRKQYEDLLHAGEITTVFRPGNRHYPNWRGYVSGEVVTVRVIEQCGSDALGVPPLFNETRIPIRITSLTVKTIDHMCDDDFEGSSPDVFDQESLAEHLQEIYQKPIECFDGAVTRITFSYLLSQPYAFVPDIWSDEVIFFHRENRAGEDGSTQRWCVLPAARGSGA
jgi:hypothetical protein